MLTSSGMAIIYLDLFTVIFLLFILTLKATEQLREIIFMMHVNVRYKAEACVSHIMRGTW